MIRVIAFQRLESFAITVLVLYAYSLLDFTWWWFVGLFLLFDLSMVGYLHSKKLGALTYNLGHSYIVPVSLLVLGWELVIEWLVILSLCWIGHVAIDRSFGYGLKKRQ